MAYKISGLPAADNTSGAEITELLQNGVNVRCALSEIFSGVFPEPDEFTATLQGVSESVTGTVYSYKIGSIVHLLIPQLLGTSTGVTLYISGLPAALRPTEPHVYTASPGGSAFRNNGAELTTESVFAHIISAQGIIHFRKYGQWALGAQKGINAPISIGYTLY